MWRFPSRPESCWEGSLWCPLFHVRSSVLFVANSHRCLPVGRQGDKMLSPQLSMWGGEFGMFPGTYHFPRVVLLKAFPHCHASLGLEVKGHTVSLHGRVFAGRTRKVGLPAPRSHSRPVPGGLGSSLSLEAPAPQEGVTPGRSHESQSHCLHRLLFVCLSTAK